MSSFSSFRTRFASIRKRGIRVAVTVAGIAGVMALSGCVVAPAYPAAGVYVRPAPVYGSPYRHHHHHHHGYYPRSPYRRW